MEWLVKAVVVVLVAYAILVAGCAVMQRSLMYFPASSLPTPAAAGAPEMQVVAPSSFRRRAPPCSTNSE